MLGTPGTREEARSHALHRRRLIADISHQSDISRMPMFRLSRIATIVAALAVIATIAFSQVPSPAATTAQNANIAADATHASADTVS